MATLSNVSYLLALFDDLLATFDANTKTVMFYKDHIATLVKLNRIKEDDVKIIEQLINFDCVDDKEAWAQEIDNKKYFVRVVDKILRNNQSAENVLTDIVSDPAANKYEKVLQLVAKVFNVSITIDTASEKNTYFGTYAFQDNTVAKNEVPQKKMAHTDTYLKASKFGEAVNVKMVGAAYALYQKLTAVLGNISKYVIYIARNESTCCETCETYSMYNIMSLGIGRTAVRLNTFKRLLKDYENGALIYICKRNEDVEVASMGLYILTVCSDATEVLMNFLREYTASN